jgi:futalosine hydrolase
VNTVHGDDRSIAEAVRRFDPQVESMEGAAFMYACTIGGVPFAQVRAVSNIVERRNRAAWRLQDALAALNAAALAIADQL